MTQRANTKTRLNIGSRRKGTRSSHYPSSTPPRLPVCGTGGLQVLYGLPDPPNCDPPTGEPLDGLHSPQAVPDLHQQAARPLFASAASSSWLLKVSVPSSLPWISLREAKTVMLFSASMVNAVMLSSLTLAGSSAGGR